MPQPRTLSPSHPRPYPTPLVHFLRVTTHPPSRLTIHVLSEGTRPVTLFSWGSRRPLLYCSLAPLLQPQTAHPPPHSPGISPADLVMQHTCLTPFLQCP